MDVGKDREARGICGARTRSGDPCKNVAGKGTDHLGVGRCKFHGGATPIRHGFYSKVQRETIGEMLAKLRVRKGVKWSEFWELVEELWEVVTRHVDDPETLERIGEEWIDVRDNWLQDFDNIAPRAPTAARRHAGGPERQGT